MQTAGRRKFRRPAVCLYQMREFKEMSSPENSLVAQIYAIYCRSREHT